MPKHEAFTPKAIGKRIKSKGLQKLKWFCQMCQKQCRDENGFKCHTTSEAHQRQLLLFAENPHKYMDAFSSEFLKDFLHLIKTRFGTRRVFANQVYQEYIKDRDHLHMNATRWVTLTGMVKWMGKKGIVVADQTEKGWFITYIDRDPEKVQKQKNLLKRQKVERDYEERQQLMIEEQVQRGKELETNTSDNSHDNTNDTKKELRKEREEEKITFTLKPRKVEEKLITDSELSVMNTNKLITLDKTDKSDTISISSKSSMKRKLNVKDSYNKKSALDQIIEEQERLRQKSEKHDYWLLKGIIVKIITNSFDEKYYKKKGVVEKVEDKYTCILRVLDSNDVLKLDQKHVETVIPQIGRKVLVLRGLFRGLEATLLDVNYDKFCVKIRIDSEVSKGRVVDGIKYEDISKLNV
ncbi:DNA/RNA-binding protein KIN17-like [Oppia nitens]|uniref:DNA/RNA-binding protein KIN17-like n=1 Tax=Oppia nitens TaxID=1686743 RepID=UPI0023DBD775|nr:DNA/RNA-binding protein KIN17-like [Oppia nitens]